VTRALRLTKDVSRPIRLGHPWVYRDAFATASGDAAELVDVIAPTGETLGRGFYDPDGPIAVRLLGAPDEVAAPDFVARRVASAAALRALARHRIDSDGVRLIHGEGDFLPGLVLDWYAGVGVARFDGAAAAAMWRPHAATIGAVLGEAGFPLRALVERGGRRSGEGGVLAGELPPEVTIAEAGCTFEVDVVRGQKTGFFLDQRDNRRLVGELAAGLSVLNLFAYTGGFSVAAGRGGARKVTTVDSAAPAIAAARRNLTRNGLDPGELVAEDVWKFLERARAARRVWDVVVCDPPSFAPSARALPGALRAYRELNLAAADVVAAGGLLVTASCSSHVTPAMFQDAVAAGVAHRPRARVLEARGAGLDHPVVPAFPEGRYLKLLVVAL
jgi:23S rRNA (cytosine1962-C5)-methyltransferase